MIYTLPALISLLLGALIVKASLKDRFPNIILTCFLSAAMGLGASGLLTFTSFIIFDRLVPWFIILLNLGVIAGLILLLKKTGGLDVRPMIKKTSRTDLLVLAALLALAIPMFLFASLYPYGGWDAWGSWNVKARYLFLAGESWSRMFDPVLWRSQILYPLLLPLMNVWVWSFGSGPTYTVPMAMTCVIPLTTAGILCGGLKELTGKTWIALAGPVLIFSNMFVIQLAASQYSDLLVGLYILTGVVLFLLFQKTHATGYLLLMGLALGMASFTKVEGSALCLVSLGAALWLLRARQTSGRAMTTLAVSTALAMVPLMIFMIFYAPRESGIFINGLTSSDHPVTFQRLITIASSLVPEFISAKWGGIWIALFICLFLSGKRSLRRELWILPALLGIYIVIFSMTYFVNTFYAINWWLNTSLNRVIFAMLPLTTLWAFLSLHEEK